MFASLSRQLSPSSLGRKLLYLVAAFAVLFASNFLAYNYLLRQLDQTAAAVDAAGRQRMLSQKIAYSALLASAGGDGGQLRRLAADFEETLAAFRHGGYSRTFFVHPAPEEMRPLLDKEEALWQEYRGAALDLASSRPGTAGAKAAITRIEAGSEPLLAACDAVTEAFRLHAKAATARLNLLMMALDALMLLLGSGAVFFAFKKVTGPIVAMSGAARDLAAGVFTGTGAEGAGGEIEALSRTFSSMAGRIGRDRDKQAALNRLLAVSAGHGTLNELLGRLLDAVLEIPWLKLQSKGAVFLAEPGAKELKMAAQRGLTPEAVAAFCSDTRLSPLSGSMQPHGYYCLPLKAEGEPAGVLTLYREAGQAYEEEERLFLESAAAIMAKAIEYKALEAKAYQAQKMESLGKAAGAVAHDFNNILTVIKGFNELIIDTAPPGSDATRYAKEAGTGIDRGSALVKQVLAFSRAQPQEMAVLDLNAAIEAARPMLGMVLGRNIALKLHLAAGLPGIRANRGQLDQVLMNLAVNARDAMQPGGGEFAIATSAAAGGVRLEVRDNGCGMPPEIAERVFEPFFTTKPEGVGTGLGLSTVYSIVKAHGGEISLDSAPGRGTLFAITFPSAAVRT